MSALDVVRTLVDNTDLLNKFSYCWFWADPIRIKLDPPGVKFDPLRIKCDPPKIKFESQGIKIGPPDIDYQIARVKVDR